MFLCAYSLSPLYIICACKIQAQVISLLATNHLHWKPSIPPPDIKEGSPKRSKTPRKPLTWWQLHDPDPEPDPCAPREPSFHYPQRGWWVLTHCCLVEMWFYNMFLKLNSISWDKWQQLTTKLLLPKTAPTLKSALRDNFDKDNPTLPCVKPAKQKAPRTRQQVLLMAAMMLLSQASGTGQAFHTKAELQHRQSLRKYRACTGVLDTSRIKGQALIALQKSVQASNQVFQAAVNNSSHAFSAVADSGCSETCSPYLTDFIPGTMYKLEEPLSLGRT